KHRFSKLDVTKVSGAFCRSISTCGTLLARLESPEPVIHQAALHRHTVFVVCLGRRDLGHRELAHFGWRPDAELYSAQYFCRFFHHPNLPPYTFSFTSILGATFR